MAYQKPQAIIHQQFETIPTIVEDELRAVIVGPSAILHRYADADEKTDIFVGIVNPDKDTNYPYPGRSAGGVVDYSYSKLYVDNALLSYFDSTNYTVTSKNEILRVVTGVSDSNVFATFSDNFTTFTGTTADITEATALSADDDTGIPVKLFKYKRSESNDLPLYSKSGEETTDPLEAGVDLYFEDDPSTTNKNEEDPTSFKHVFVEVQRKDVDKDNATSTDPVYVKADFTGYTFDIDDAAKLTKKDDLYPMYVLGSDEPTSMYKFYSPYKYDNAIVSDEAVPFNFKSTSYEERNGTLGIRDVAVGDYALIWSTVKNSSGKCVDAGPQLSRIIGFIVSDSDPSVVTDKVTIIQPEASTAVAPTWKEYINSTEGTTTVTLITTHQGNDPISPYKYGILNDSNKLSCTYKITVNEVVTSGNCVGTIFATISCDETGESRTEQLVPNETIYLSEGGVYGNTNFSFTEAQIAAIREYILAGASIAWSYSVTDAYTCLTPEDVVIFNEAYYTGPSDTYLFKVTKGVTYDNGYTAEGIELDDTDAKFNVTTAYGRENVVGASLTSTAWTTTGIDLGKQGLKLRFSTDGNRTSAETSLPATFAVSVPMIGKHAQRYNGILLADDVLKELRSSSNSDNVNDRVYVNLQLLYNSDIVLPPVSPVNDSTNWYQSVTSFTLQKNATMTLSSFLNYDGTYIPLTLFGFGGSDTTEYDQFSKLFFNYREWSPVHANEVTLCESVAALDGVIGPLDPDNPLKYAVYKALTNSNGASVGYVAVKDPTDLDDWQDALSAVEGRDDVYTVVPLSTATNVQNLALTLINGESSAEACRWKTALFSMTLPTEVMRVGYSTNNATVPTSTNGAPTMCKIVVDQADSALPINKLVCTSGNAKFIDYGVIPGDEVRILDYDSNSIKATYIVDQVYSNGTLTLTTALNSPVYEETFEIWHTYTRAEEVNVIRARAQSVASRRVGLVWPDIVEEGGVELPGYYLCAAIAGLKSGVEPQNGLTRRTIQGFDGFTRSKPRYTESQLDLMASSGVWVCVTDSDGTPQSRHALNTDTTNSFYSEEMMTRNFDSVSKYMYRVIDAYIGTSNVTDETLLSIYHNLRAACDYLIGKGQMVDYTQITVKQHDLLLDRVLAYLDVGLPFAVNNVELYITAEAYKLNAVTLDSEVE